MPYITKEDRARIVPSVPLAIGEDGKVVSVNIVKMHEINKAGELNYAITEMMIDYLNRKGVSYTNMNEVIGVLECAKMELYRRMAAPYEDTKIEENGDVYD